MLLRQGLVALVVAYLVVLSACSSSKQQDVVTGGDDSAKSVGAPLYVQVLSSFEGASDTTYQGGCYFDASESPPMTRTCTVRIPELVLHFSDLHFKIGSNDKVNCTQVAFFPYFYLRSTSPTYLPPGATTTIDCSNSDKMDCFGGAAPKMLPSFLSASGVYFLPSVKDNATYDLKSSNSIRIAGGDESFDSNVNTCNNLTDRTTAIVDPIYAYAGSGNFQDYLITCDDQWGETQYQITLKIADYDTEATSNTPAKDTYYDWGD